MFTESAMVTALSEHSIALSLVRSGGCGKCSGQAGCSRTPPGGDATTVSLPLSLLQSGFDSAGLAGAAVELQLDEKSVLELALRFYLQPLALLLLATGIAVWLNAPEAVVITAAVVGLATGFAGLSAAAPCKQVLLRPVPVLLNTRLLNTESRSGVF